MSSETKNSVDMRSLSEFDGRKENFGYFWTKFKAFLNVRGLAHVIKKTFKDVLPASEAEAATKAQKEAVKENSTVTGLFGIVITGAALLRKIEKMKTDEWPDGCGYLIADMLLNKYRPNDLLALGDQKTKLLELRLEPGQDPEELDDAIAELEIEYRKDVEESERFATVVRVAGVHPEYSATISNEIRNAKKNEEELSSQDLLEILHDQWKVAGRGKNLVEDVPTATELVNIGGTCYRLVPAGETSLVDAQGGSNRPGVRGLGPCWNCGGPHFRRDCPKPNNGQGLKCEYPGCTQPRGHATKDCWENPENASKRPSWFVPQTNQGDSVESIEVLV